MVRIRYLVNDVNESVQFYISNFDFNLKQQFGSAIAMLERDGLTLLVAGPMTSATKPMPDGTKPTPGGGWARIMIDVADIEFEVARLKENGVEFRNHIIENQGRKQILCIDPSGNLIELLQPS